MRHPEYASAYKRYASFGRQPHPEIPIEAYALAGFFAPDKSKYTQLVVCYHCGLRTPPKGKYNDPWQHHALAAPFCNHVRTLRGYQYVVEVQRYIDIMLATPPPPEPQAVEPVVLKCTMCNEQKITKIYLPCGHAATCSSCAVLIRFTTRKCPICSDLYLITHDITFP